MKKIISVLILSTIFLTGCLKRDNLEDVTIYTTVYPIEYITDRLYGANSNIYSIYPDGIIVSEYNLTNKQIQDYSKAGIFIYNGLSKEKDYVTKMFNQNNQLKIIDTTLSMEYTYGVEELWLSPSNFLMLAQNIKNGFKEYISNGYLKNEIEEKYEELKIEISNIDAKIQLLADSSTNKTLVVGSNTLGFLNKYGFNVISLDNDELTEKMIVNVQNLIVDKNIEYIYLTQNDDINDEVQALIDEYDVKIIYLYDLSNITEEQRDSNKNYITIMNENIELLKSELYD